MFSKLEKGIAEADAALRSVAAEQRAGSCALVIFGGAGDLAQRKIIPALYNALRRGQTPSGLTIIGTGMPAMNQDRYRDLMGGAIKHSTSTLDRQALDQFLQGLYYVGGDLADPQLYLELDALIHRLTKERIHRDNRLYYLAIPPSLFPTVIQNLDVRRMAQVTGPHHWRRVIIEKPFGRDLESAKALNNLIGTVFEEWQTYRIDHYLGQETVQNIMAFRFANGIFEPLWNRNYIDHIQITTAEDVGVGHQGPYYEELGTLRDTIQNHLLQILALVAMEPPATFDANAVRDEKVKVLRAIRPFALEQVDNQVVSGQYGEGTMGLEKVKGYRSEPGVSPESTRETFVAAKCCIDNWRWADVPFYIRSGKRLPKRISEIAIFFKRTPHLMFRRSLQDRANPNLLLLQMQPDESITIRFEAKYPGPQMELRSVNMDFNYKKAFQVEIMEAYERLILDCMRGDATLFMRKDALEIAWWLIMPILKYWQQNPPTDFPNYPAGSWGPATADDLLLRDGRSWHNP